MLVLSSAGKVFKSFNRTPGNRTTGNPFWRSFEARVLGLSPPQPLASFHLQSGCVRAPELGRQLMYLKRWWGWEVAGLPLWFSSPLKMTLNRKVAVSPKAHPLHRHNGFLWYINTFQFCYTSQFSTELFSRHSINSLYLLHITYD